MTVKGRREVSGGGLWPRKDKELVGNLYEHGLSMFREQQDMSRQADESLKIRERGRIG